MIRRAIIKNFCLATFFYICTIKHLNAQSFAGANIEIALSSNNYIPTYFENSSIGQFSSTYGMEHRNGGGASVNFGKIFDGGFGINAELAYKFRNDEDIEQKEFFINSELIALMFNASYVFQTKRILNPKFEFGFGGAKIEASGDYMLKHLLGNEYALGSYVDTEIDIRLIYQVGLGVLFDISEEYKVGIGYRFNAINQIGTLSNLTSTTKSENESTVFEPNSLKIFNFEFSNHSLDINFRYLIN